MFGRYAGGLSMGPLALMGCIFSLLLVFNMIFARWLLREELTPAKVCKRRERKRRESEWAWGGGGGGVWGGWGVGGGWGWYVVTGGTWSEGGKCGV